MITVVGIGADGMAGLALPSIQQLRSARIVYGSLRQLGLLDDTVTAERREWTSPMLGMVQTLRDVHDDVHVLASGDPMLHGVGAVLVKLVGPDRVTILPHVSCVTLACARLGWSVQDIEIISLMRYTPEAAVRTGGRAVVLTRDGRGPAQLARLLTETGRGDSTFAVLEQLGGPGERCRTSTARQWVADPPDDVDDLNVVAVNYLPDERRLSVLPDDAFTHDGQLTKQMMRAVTMAALAPRPGELLWDVGSGSGSIAIEWCRNGHGCTAIAFERDEVRRARIVDNATMNGVVFDVRGAAPGAFTEAELHDGGVTGVQRPAAIFIGGGLTGPRLFDECYEILPVGGRLVANAVTAESEAFVLQKYSQLGGELRRFQHYRGEPVGSFTAWRPALPVTQWAVVKS